MKLLPEVKGLLFVVLFAVLAGCGGGGGGGGNDSSEPIPPPEPEFSLATLKSTAPGPVYSTQLSGTDSLGREWTGSIAIINDEQVLQNGIMVTPQMQQGSLTMQEITASFTTTVYIDGSGVIQYRTDGDGVICTPAFPYSLPDFVKIGDGEAQPKETCTDGVESDSSWRVEDAGGENANFITIISSNDASTSEETITIDVVGNILAYEQVVSSDGVTLTLRSP